MELLNLSAAQLRRAADITDQIGKLKTELRTILAPESIFPAGTLAHTALTNGAPKRYVRTPEHAANLARSIKRSWAARQAPKRNGVHKWTPAQRAKFKATMRARGFHRV